MNFKPEGEVLNFGTRADIKHLPPSENEESLFNDNLKFYNMEKAEIESEIKNNIKDICKDSSKIDELINKIKTSYTIGCKDDDKAIEALLNNVFKKKYVSKSKNIVNHIIVLVALVFELGLFIFANYTQGGGSFNPYFIVIISAAAIGGILLGNLIGYHAFEDELRKLQMFNNADSDKTYIQKYTLGLIGVGLILFSAFLRAIGGEGFDFRVFIITIAISMIVLVAEFYREKESRLRKWSLEEQIDALRKYATKLHKGNLKNYIESIKNKCKEISNVEKEE